MFFNTILLFCVILNCVRSSPEGSACTIDGVNGTCLNVYRCPSSKEKLRNHIFPPICSFQGTIPVVCCTDAVLVLGRLSVQNPKGGTLEKSGEKAWDKCLDYLDTLPYECKTQLNSSSNDDISTVVGGSDAYRGQFPHMALLGFGEYEDSIEWLCGGTVISDRYILTAGHCKHAPRIGPLKYAVLGLLKRSDPPQLWNKYEIQRIITHPEYKPPTVYNDIALLETRTSITFNNFILPACLPVTRPNKMDDLTASASGWGSVNLQETLADTMQMVTLHKLDEEVCSPRDPERRPRHMKAGLNTTTQICYGDRDFVKNTCRGDSGGPLQISGQASECQYTVIGVTSTGRDCEQLGSAGIYTRVHHFVPWIESIVWP